MREEVVYEEIGTSQTWNADGTTSYNDRERVWSVRNGMYCSKGQERDPICWNVRLEDAGSKIVFLPNRQDPETYVGVYQ